MLQFNLLISNQQKSIPCIGSWHLLSTGQTVIAVVAQWHLRWRQQRSWRHKEKLVHLQLLPKSLFLNKSRGVLGLPCCRRAFAMFLHPTYSHAQVRICTKAILPSRGSNMEKAIREESFLALWFIWGAGLHRNSLTQFGRGSKPQTAQSPRAPICTSLWGLLHILHPCGPSPSKSLSQRTPGEDSLSPSPYASGNQSPGDNSETQQSIQIYAQRSRVSHLVQLIKMMEQA